MATIQSTGGCGSSTSRVELRFSLRSLHRFAPWVERVFLVTNGQVPPWLNRNHPRLRLVTHEQIFGNSNHLPTFNSNAIETNLFGIPDVGADLIYFNDDFLLGAPVCLEDFRNPDDGIRVYAGGLLVPSASSDHFAEVDAEGRQRELSTEEVQHLRNNLSSWIEGQQFSNSLLDEAFGPRRRRSIAHVPYLLDREIWCSMEQRWGGALRKTSSHRFRTPEDVVVSFLQLHCALELSIRGEGPRDARLRQGAWQVRYPPPGSRPGGP